MAKLNIYMHVDRYIQYVEDEAPIICQRTALCKRTLNVLDDNDFMK